MVREPASDAPTAAILASGEELIAGRSTDTNSTWLQRRLRALGVAVLESRQVGDGTEPIAAALDDLARRHRYVISTGGLGPTEDDRTREAVARTGGAELVFVEEAWQDVQAFFRRLGRKPSPSNRRQALLPRGATLLRNERGTAPGFEMPLHAATLFALPGVPAEMVWMFDAHVAPRLRAREHGPALLCWTLGVVGLPESEAGERIAPWMRSAGPPDVGITAHGGTLTVSLSDRDDADGRRRLAAARDALRAALGEHCYTEGERSLAQCVVEQLRERSFTVAVAESCTGGLVAAALTEVPGASDVFLEGCVTYSCAAKVTRLGVQESTLEQHGAVSSATAREMAEGVRRTLGATFGVGITGIAGPAGGSPQKPVGRVHVAVAGPQGTRDRVFDFPGDRDAVRRRAAVTAINLLRLDIAR